MADERFDELENRILEKLNSIEKYVEEIDERLRTLKRSMTDLEIAYICDRMRCEKCHPDCYLTKDIEHAANFTCLGEGGKWGSSKYVEKQRETCQNCFYSGKNLEDRMYCIAWGIDGAKREWTKPYGYCHKWKEREDG